MKISSYYVQQRHHGIEIFSAVLNFAVRNGEVVHVGDRFVANVANEANASIPSLSVLDALEKACVLLDIQTFGNTAILENPTTNNYRISNGFSQKNPVKGRLVLMARKKSAAGLRRNCMTESMGIYRRSSFGFWVSTSLI